MTDFLFEFTLEGLPKMTNGLNVHWRIKHSEAKRWKIRVKEQCYNVLRDERLPLQKAKLTFTRHSTREPDFDGLVSGFKHVLDGLVEAGVLVNDKVSIIGQPEYKWVYAKPGKGKVSVRVEGRYDERRIEAPA